MSFSNPRPAKHRDHRALTRRQALQTLGAGAAAVAGMSMQRKALAAGGAGAPATASMQPLHPVTPQVQPFPLTAVRLLDGPFLDAQKRDEKYMLSLEPDRMLHNFRVNAGLEPKAPVYGGWESVATWADVRAEGHTLGHYLTACSLMYASTGTEEYKKRCDYIVADLQECQAAGKTGLICAFRDKTAQIDNLVAGRRVIGVPWYTLHKIFAGLRDSHLYCQSAAALEVLTKLADWAIAATHEMTDAQFQRMLNTEHGGMNEVLADLYAITGKEKYLTLSERFCHRVILDPLADGRDTLNGLHSNTQIPKIVGFQRLYQLTGKTNYRDAAAFFWKDVVNTRSFATGGHGDTEHFFPLNQFATHLGSAKTMETCCSHNMLRLTRMLFTVDPTAAYADFYERTLINTILASQDPDTGMVTYFQSTRPGYLKLYCTPVDSFWCCTGTGIENHAKYGDSIYFHGADALYVNLFLASTVNWKEKGVTVTQKTNFPEAGKTRLEIAAASPMELTLNIRHPRWCAAATVTVNGSPATTSRTPETFIALKRTWKTGDVIEVDMPMTVRMELLPGTTDTAAAVYGPIVLVGALGKKIKPGEDLFVNERLIGTTFTDPAEVPTLAGDVGKLAEKIKPTGEALTFKTEGIGRPGDVTLVPYYKMTHERYNMYWKIQNA